MNRIDWSQLGGHPLVLNDLAFVQSATIDSFTALVKAFKGPQPVDYYVLNGAVATNAGAVSGGINYDITDGYIVLNGEILRITAGTFFVATGQKPVFRVDQSFDTLDPTQYLDGTFKNVHLVRKGKIETVSNAILNDFEVLNAPTVANALRGYLTSDFNAKADRIQTAWQYVGIGGGQPFLNGWANEFDAPGDVQSLRFRKDNFGLVHISFRNVSNPSASGGGNSTSTVFTMPEGFRPTYLVHYPILYTPDGGTTKLCYMRVFPAGDVEFFNGDGFETGALFVGSIEMPLYIAA